MKPVSTDDFILAANKDADAAGVSPETRYHILYSRAPHYIFITLIAVFVAMFAASKHLLWMLPTTVMLFIYGYWLKHYVARHIEFCYLRQKDIIRIALIAIPLACACCAALFYHNPPCSNPMISDLLNFLLRGVSACQGAG